MELALVREESDEDTEDKLEFSSGYVTVRGGCHIPREQRPVTYLAPQPSARRSRPKIFNSRKRRTQQRSIQENIYDIISEGGQAQSRNQEEVSTEVVAERGTSNCCSWALCAVVVTVALVLALVSIAVVVASVFNYGCRDRMENCTIGNLSCQTKYLNWSRKTQSVHCEVHNNWSLADYSVVTTISRINVSSYSCTCKLFEGEDLNLNCSLVLRDCSIF